MKVIPVLELYDVAYQTRAMLTSSIGKNGDFKLPFNGERCLAHIVCVGDDLLAADYLRSAWMHGKYDRHNSYFVFVAERDLDLFANDTILMDFERLNFVLHRDSSVSKSNV